jgi:hypothetical protein
MTAVCSEDQAIHNILCGENGECLEQSGRQDMPKTMHVKGSWSIDPYI